MESLERESPQRTGRQQAATPDSAAHAKQPAQRQQEPQQAQSEQQPCSICFEDVPEMMHSFGVWVWSTCECVHALACWVCQSMLLAATGPCPSPASPALPPAGPAAPAAACSHAFCLPCLREYISGKVADRAFPVPCPLPDCKQPISAAECGLVLTAEEMAALGQVGWWATPVGEAGQASTASQCARRCSLLADRRWGLGRQRMDGGC